MKSNISIVFEEYNPIVGNHVNCSDLIRSIDNFRERDESLNLGEYYNDGLTTCADGIHLRKILNKMSAIQELLEDR